MKKTFYIFIVLLTSLNVRTIADSIIIPSSTQLPRDSSLKNQLLADLNGFLAQKENENSLNEFVLKDCFLETSDLLDEMKGIEENETTKDEHFYKAYFTGLSRLRDSSYTVRISYMGVLSDQPILRAVFTLRAKRQGAGFKFYSPLKENTRNWKSEQFGFATIHFKDVLNKQNAEQYFAMVQKFDKRLGAPIMKTDLYCAENFPEMLHILGVDYQSDYSNRAYGSTNSRDSLSLLIVDGNISTDFADIDPHDLWHSRLHNVVSTSVINKPVDEGTAFLNGGSWGMSWEEILAKYKEYVKANPGVDWLSLYNESAVFAKKDKYPLNVDYMINALIVQKLEKEKGFPAVVELLSCGKRVDGNENYFAALQKITGVKKADFNNYVNKLIAEN